MSDFSTKRPPFGWDVVEPDDDEVGDQLAAAFAEVSRLRSENKRLRTALFAEPTNNTMLREVWRVRYALKHGLGIEAPYDTDETVAIVNRLVEASLRESSRIEDEAGEVS